MSETKQKYAGANWIKKDLKTEMSALGETVADILGRVWYGIYHMSEKALRRVEWKNEMYMSVIIDEELATWDFCALTELVVLCHDRCVRMSVQGCGPHRTRLMFHARVREGDIALRHPTIEEAIGRARGDA